MFRNNVFFTLIGLILSGCSNTEIFPSGNFQNPEEMKPKVLNEKINKEYKVKSNLNSNNQFHVIYKMELEGSDLDIIENDNEKIKFELKDSNTSDTIESLSMLLNKGVLYDIEGNYDSILDRKTPILKLNTDISGIIISIERSLNVDVTIRDDTLVVRNFIRVEGQFTNIEEDDTSVYANIKNNVSKLLGKNTTIFIDELTGAFSISSDPNSMRNYSGLIERMINEATSSAWLRMKIYKLNNEALKEKGVNATAVIDGLTMIAGSSITATASEETLSTTWNKVFSGSKEAGDLKSLNASFKALEKIEILNSVATPSINIFNGIESQLSNTKEIGYWLPGEVTKDNTSNSNTSFSSMVEGRPEYELDKKGRTIKILPKIDYINRTVHLRINYTNSDVYKIDSFTWDRQFYNPKNKSTVTLSKPLKAESTFNARIVLFDGVYGFISGDKTETSEILGSGLPQELSISDKTLLGMSKNKSSLSDTLIVARVDFPKKTRIQYIKKSK